MACPLKWNLFGSTLYFHMVLFVFQHNFYKLKFGGKFFLEQGANLESRAAHTHPKKYPSAPPPREFWLGQYWKSKGQVNA